MKGFTIEREVGKVDLNKNNILIKDLDNMIELEYWENRLENELKIPFVIAFRKKEGKFVYSIFTELRKKGSVFK
jgi:hypothetical protein